MMNSRNIVPQKWYEVIGNWNEHTHTWEEFVHESYNILHKLGFTLEKIVHANETNISEDVKSYKISLASNILRTGIKIAELKLNGRYTFDDFNQGVTLSMKATDEVSQQHDWGTFYLVDKSHLEYSDHMDETVITLHDGVIKAHQEFLASDLGIAFPCSIDTLINAIGS